MPYNIKEISYLQIKSEIENRFFPRKLIIYNSENAFMSAFNEVLYKLNSLNTTRRVYQLPIEGDFTLDLTKVNAKGIEVKTIDRIYPTQEINTAFNMYAQVLGNSPFYYNIIRNQDTFLDFLFVSSVMKDLWMKYKNYEKGYFIIGNKVYLDRNVFDNYLFSGSALIVYIPQFKQVNNINDVYEFAQIELQFIYNYLEGLVMFREGRAQSELTFSGGSFETNYDLYLSEGKEKMEKAEEVLKASMLKNIYVRF